MACCPASICTRWSITDIVADGHGFTALLADGGRISARRVIVTTGLRDELPDIPGLRARWARDVLHCPYCHGHEVSGRRLGVIGGTPGAVRYAQIVRQWTNDLFYFTPSDVLTAAERTELLARGIGIVEGAVDQLVTDLVDEDVRVAVRHLDHGLTLALATKAALPKESA